MLKTITYQILCLIFGLGLLFAIPTSSCAQEKDSTHRELNLDKKERDIHFKPRMDREMTGGKMTKMGSYDVPTETEYYTPPFKGQEYLDMAVEAYRQELEEHMGSNWFWKFLDTISPYIYNDFEFGVYQINDMPIVDRNNELFKSYRSNDKRK